MRACFLKRFLIVFLICLVFNTQICIADVKYNGKISPIIAAKEAPKMVLTMIAATPLAICPIVNLFAVMAAENSVTPAKYRVLEYEQKIFRKNAKNEIDEIKSLPILEKIYNNDEYYINRFVSKYGITYQNYEYKIKIADLMYKKYVLEKQTEIDKHLKSCIEQAFWQADEETYPALEYLIEKDLICKSQYKYVSKNSEKRNDLLNGYYEEYYSPQNKEGFWGLSESDYMLFRNNGFSIDEIKEFIAYKNQYENNQVFKAFAQKYIEMKKENLSQEKMEKKINKIISKEEKKIAKQKMKKSKKSFEEMPDGVVLTGVYFVSPFIIYKAIGKEYVEDVKFKTYKSKRKKELKNINFY